MMIDAQLAKAFNEQIGHEFGASMQYVSIAAHFQRHNLTLLGVVKQAGEKNLLMVEAYLVHIEKAH